MSRLGSLNKETLEWPDGFRKCRKCGEIKPFSAFHKHKQCAQGINTVCKECRKPLSTANWNNTSEEYKIWHRAKSRATKKGLDFNLEISDIKIPKVCPVFKVPFDKTSNDYTYSIDRIDPREGYVKGNVMIISNKANRIKSDASRKEIEQVLSYVYGCEATQDTNDLIKCED
jgi:hypothetical protein